MLSYIQNKKYIYDKHQKKNHPFLSKADVVKGVYKKDDRYENRPINWYYNDIITKG